MNLNDALYHAVHDYPGGVAALAARMGLKASTLYSMANPREDAHPWSMQRVMQVAAMTGDHRIAHAICEACGGVFIPLGKPADGAAGAYQRMVSAAAAFGDVARAFENAMKDGRITPRERDAIANQGYESISATADFLAQLDRDAAVQTPGALKVAK